MKKMNKKGFTLIEMLVVIAIIAILVAIVIPTVNNATKKAKQATDVANIRSAIAEYEIDTLTDPDATFPFDTVQGDLNYGDEFTQSEDGTTLSYTADLLQDDPYTWTVGNIYSED